MISLNFDWGTRQTKILFLSWFKNSKLSSLTKISFQAKLGSQASIWIKVLFSVWSTNKKIKQSYLFDSEPALLISTSNFSFSSPNFLIKQSLQILFFNSSLVLKNEKRKQERKCIFRPTQIRYTPLLTYAKSQYYTYEILTRGFTAAKTCGRSARPPSMS